MRLFAYLSAALAVRCSLAVFLDEAYQVDYHHALLGLPKAAETFFHAPFAGSKASLLFTLSEKSVLGAVNPKDGSLVWRQRLTSNESETSALLRFGHNQDRIITGHSSTISAWSSSDGRLIWQDAFEEGMVQALDLVNQESMEAVYSPLDAIVVLQGQNSIVKRIEVETGTTKWSFEDSSGDTAVRVAVAGKQVYLISTHATLLRGLKLKVTILDTHSGEKLEQYTLSSDSEIDSEDDILYFGATGTSALLIWSNPSRDTLKINSLGSKAGVSLDLKPTEKDIERVDVHFPQQSEVIQAFLIHFESSDKHWAEVFQIDTAENSVSKVIDVPHIDGHGTFSATVGAKAVYFTRITQGAVTLFSASSASPLSSWPISSFRVPGLAERAYPIDASSEIVVRSESSYAVRSAVLLSTGDWILIRNGQTVWVRHESLAGVVAAEWADIWEKDNLLEHIAEEEEEKNFINVYIHRLTRHIQDIRTLLQWLKELPQLLQNIWIEFQAGQDDDIAKGRAFGFHKLIIVATENGRIIALEAGNRGRVLWNLPIDSVPGRQRKWTSKDIGSLEATLIRLGEHPNHGTLPPSWVGLTSYQNPQLHILDPQSMLVKDGGSNVPSILKQFSYKVEDGTLQGLRNDKVHWDFRPMSGEQIMSVVSSLSNEAIASIGKALGDRRVLYKYLNPNAIVVIATDNKQKKASLYLLDSVSGQVLHSARYHNVDTSRPLCALVSENWYAFAFTADTIEDTISKGYQLVMTELYESSLPNDRGLLGSSRNYSSTSPKRTGSKPHVVSQVFHIPEEITSMAVTQTGQGITSRQLLVGLSGTSSLVAIPRQALDPRRIVGRDPIATEIEEGLSRYMPMLDFDAKWYLNHREEILGIGKIITTPAALESTSLVFAYGFDIFGTRVAPSFAFDILGSGFNKLQLVITVAVLTVGVFVAAPWIQRKQTNALWQD